MGLVWPVLGETPVLGGLAPDARQAVTRAAVDYLSRWSGGLYGLTEATVRPVRVPQAGGPRWAVGRWAPVHVGGVWAMLSCDRCADQFCGCSAMSLRFPFRVHEVVSVTVDGDLLVAWRLDGHRVLHRTDGEGWPTRQDLALPVTETGTFQIVLTRGLPVPDGGQIAAGVLAEEIAKAVAGDASCRLPARVQTITRQGVTIGMLDAMDDLAGGKTGLWLVDSWLSSVNDAPRVSGVWSPDSMGGVEYL